MFRLLKKLGAVDEIWIGLTRTNKDSNFYWLDGTSGEYRQWAEGIAFLLIDVSLFEGRPENFSIYRNCVYILVNGTWSDTNCGMQKSFICQVEAGSAAM